MSIWKNVLQRVLSTRGYRLTTLKAWDSLLEVNSQMRRDLQIAAKAAVCLQLTTESVVGAETVASYLKNSTSQFAQDFFVLWELGFKRDGFFVEFGATDGVSISNTYLLEKQFGWKGILAEPALCWHKRLRENRDAIIETACIWSTSGETLAFAESGELSTAASLVNSDEYASIRAAGKIEYPVETLSLVDLLRKHDAPSHIDFLSIDTEGSELSILQAFPFPEYRFAVICCEHNFTENRGKIHQLLSLHGYQRKWEQLSSVDDWYVYDPKVVANGLNDKCDTSALQPSG